MSNPWGSVALITAIVVIVVGILVAIRLGNRQR